jgi:hypothetical protein
MAPPSLATGSSIFGLLLFGTITSLFAKIGGCIQTYGVKEHSNVMEQLPSCFSVLERQ